jgi:excisionase family DNA binding protein
MNDRDYLTSSEAAKALHVSPKTITRWANEGRINHMVTLGGHRRFLRRDVDLVVAQVERSMRPDTDADTGAES